MEGGDGGTVLDTRVAGYVLLLSARRLDVEDL